MTGHGLWTSAALSEAGKRETQQQEDRPKLTHSVMHMKCQTTSIAIVLTREPHHRLDR